MHCLPTPDSRPEFDLSHEFFPCESEAGDDVRERQHNAIAVSFARLTSTTAAHQSLVLLLSSRSE